MPHITPLNLRATNEIALRTAKIPRADASLLSGLDIDENRMDEIPNQIRDALNANLLRVVDLF